MVAILSAVVSIFVFRLRSRAALENGESYNIEAGLLKAEDKLKSYDGLFTDEYVK